MSARLSAALFIASALAGPAAAQDASEFVVRLNRLENQVRQMSGHIEQLQYENGQLKAQLRKFQEDVEFRFQERPGAPRSAGPAAAHPQAAPPVAQPGATPSIRPPRPMRRARRRRSARRSPRYRSRTRVPSPA
jgi:TolA-binding protein